MNRVQKFIIKTVRFYQKYFSPDHSFWAKIRWNHYCKYFPTCSEYMIEDVEKKWAFKWFFMWVWRIMRCMPWSKWWIDFVEKEKNKKTE